MGVGILVWDIVVATVVAERGWKREGYVVVWVCSLGKVVWQVNDDVGDSRSAQGKGVGSGYKS